MTEHKPYSAQFRKAGRPTDSEHPICPPEEEMHTQERTLAMVGQLIGRLVDELPSNTQYVSYMMFTLAEAIIQGSSFICPPEDLTEQERRMRVEVRACIKARREAREIPG